MFAAPMMMTSPSGASATDPDAAAYVAAVESADGQALEAAVVEAIDAFVIGLKADGTWANIDQCAILAGARSLAGALVPLVGPAPVNNNFVAGDYARKTGLKGDGATKYLKAAAATYGKNDAHLAVWIGESYSPSTTEGFMGNSTTASGGSSLITTATLYGPRVNWTGSGSNISDSNPRSGFFGGARSAPTQIGYRFGGATGSLAQSSASPNLTDQFNVFARGATPPSNLTVARLGWFSHGAAITLVDLDARLTTLMSAFAASIP